MKRVARNVAVNVSKQVFVRRDAESGRSTLPFDFKSASHIDISERADCAFIRFDMAVATNSYPIASSRQDGARRERNNRYFLHSNMVSLITMQQPRILDSTNVQRGLLSRSPLRRLGLPSPFPPTAGFSSLPPCSTRPPPRILPG